MSAFFLITFLSAHIMHTQPDFYRIYNPDLPIVKDGWKGNLTLNGRFVNGTVIENTSMREVLKWRFSKNPQEEEKKRDPFQLPTLALVDFTSKENSIVWLGHSSFIIVMDETVLLTDPCFFDLPVVRRKVPLPCAIDSIRPVDYLLISHDHRDHFDRKSVEQISVHNPNMTALLPLKVTMFVSAKVADRFYEPFDYLYDKKGR